MPRSSVVIEVSPCRLELAVVRGRTVQTVRAMRHEGLNWAEPWPTPLAELGGVLSKWVRELGLAGASATLLYARPDPVSLVLSCPAGVGAGKAAEAAAMALTEAAGFSLANNPHDICELGIDKGGGEDPAKRHVAGFAEQDAAALGMARWLTDAGLTPERLTPVAAVGMMSAARRAMVSDGAVVVFRIGENSSVLAAAVGGKLKFERQINIGLQTISGALRREIMTAGGTVNLTDSEAARLLREHGIPKVGAVFDEGRGLNAGSVLPLLQPVLQRASVEIKQSIRFGMSEAERGGAVLVVTGMGAGVPRLSEVLGGQVGLTAAPREGCELSSEEPTSSTCGDIAGWLAAGANGPGLLPMSICRERGQSRLRRGLLIGAGVAMVVVGAEAVTTRLELDAVNQRVSVLSARQNNARTSVALAEQLAASQGAVARIERRAAEWSSGEVPWEVVLATLSRTTPEYIRLADIEFRSDEGKPVAWLRGVARGGSLSGTDLDAGVMLKPYIDSLAGLPIVRSCRLQNAQRIAGTDHAASGQEFQILLNLVGVSPLAPAAIDERARAGAAASAEKQP